MHARCFHSKYSNIYHLPNSAEGLHFSAFPLYQLFLLRVEDCPQLLTWLYKREYISSKIVYEFIAIMGNTVLRQVLALINSALWYSLIADEATDISHNEQIGISIRWVDSSYEVHKDTLVLFQLPNAKAQTLFTFIKDILIRCFLPIFQRRGQAFDGASNMTGIRNGVQALVKQEENRALYVHCLCHSLKSGV